MEGSETAPMLVDFQALVFLPGGAALFRHIRTAQQKILIAWSAKTLADCSRCGRSTGQTLHYGWIVTQEKCC